MLSGLPVGSEDVGCAMPAVFEEVWWSISLLLGRTLKLCQTKDFDLNSGSGVNVRELSSYLFTKREVVEDEVSHFSEKVKVRAGE